MGRAAAIDGLTATSSPAVARAAAHGQWAHIRPHIHAWRWLTRPGCPAGRRCGRGASASCRPPAGRGPPAGHSPPLSHVPSGSHTPAASRSPPAGYRRRAGQLPCDLPGRPDQQRLVQPAAPLAAEQFGTPGLQRDPAQHADRPEHLAHLGERAAEHPVIGDDQHADPGVLAATLAHRQRHGRGSVPQPHHLAQAGPGDQDDGSGVGQQVVVSPVRAEPAAVRDHVGLRQPGQYAADRSPQRFRPAPCSALVTPSSTSRPPRSFCACAQSWEGCRSRRAATARLSSPRRGSRRLPPSPGSR